MADQAQQDNALLSAEDRATLNWRLDSHIAFENSAKSNDADKIAPGGPAKRAEFITDYIGKLEKEWEANPGKGTFKSTVLTNEGNFSAKFQKKLETLGDAFKVYETERAEQAAVATRADMAQLVDASVAGPAVEIKEPGQNKDAAAQKTATEKLRSHLTALAKEFSESAPENELSDAELNALIGNYLIKRRDTIAKDTNTKASLASDASALSADGTIDTAVAKDFKEQLPQLHAEYIKSMTTPANPARNPNGFAPIAPQPGTDSARVDATVTSPTPNTGVQAAITDVENEDYDFIGKNDEAAKSLRQGGTNYWTNLDFNALVVINTLYPGFGSNPALHSIARSCWTAENDRRAELKSPEPALSYAEWNELRSSNAALKSAFEAKVKSQFDFFGTEANKAHGLGFKAMYLKINKKGEQELVLQSAGEDETEFVVTQKGVRATNMPGPFRNTTASQLALATLSTHKLQNGASTKNGEPKKSIEIIVDTKGFALPKRKQIMRDMSLIASAYHAKKTGQPIELFYMEDGKKVPVGTLKKIHPDAIAEMAMIFDPKDLDEALKDYNERHGEVSLTVAPQPPQPAAANILRSASTHRSQAPTAANPIIVNRPGATNSDPANTKQGKNSPLPHKPQGRSSSGPTIGQP